MHGVFSSPEHSFLASSEAAVGQVSCKFVQKPFKCRDILVCHVRPGLVMQSVCLVAQKRNQLVSRITKMHLPYSAICVVRTTFDKLQVFHPIDRLADRCPFKIKQSRQI